MFQSMDLVDNSHELRDREVFWRDHYDWLKERGYLLRPRYRPGWVASWIGTDIKFPEKCEDYYIAVSEKLSSNDHVGDATLGLADLLNAAPQSDPATGLYPESATGTHDMREYRLPLTLPKESLEAKHSPYITIRCDILCQVGRSI